MRTAQREVNKKKNCEGVGGGSLCERLHQAKSFSCAERGTLVITYDVKEYASNL